jgi:signal transduction histidine kinase
MHRLLQESLTNVARHAPAETSVRVAVAVHDDDVSMCVENDSRHPTAGQGTRTIMAPGFGLIGMRERVEALGGAFSAGPTARGGWRVHAVLPYAVDR